MIVSTPFLLLARRRRTCLARAVAWIIAAVTCALAPGARAQDASFGCKVLLCAAATAPAWSGIPYCVPVMQQLFRDLAHGGSWPVCSEGQASSVGYDPYLPCPAGLSPMIATPLGVAGPNLAQASLVQASNGQAQTPDPEGNLCADLSKPQQVCGTAGMTSCQTTYPTIPRDARADPYFVDIDTANGAQRFYFSLQGY